MTTQFPSTMTLADLQAALEEHNVGLQLTRQRRPSSDKKYVATIVSRLGVRPEFSVDGPAESSVWAALESAFYIYENKLKEALARQPKGEVPMPTTNLKPHPPVPRKLRRQDKED